MAKLFVSYSRKDSVASRKIILALKEMGEDIWVDWEDIPPAADWLEQIFHGIEGSDAFIFMISPDSIKSEVCTQEVRHAARNNKRIIPVVLRQVEPKDTNEIIRKLNWIFMRDEDDFKGGLKRIKTAIELDFQWVEEHNRLQLRALEWDRRKDASLLLRGRDLRLGKNALLMAETKRKDPPPTSLQRTYVRHSTGNERRVYSAVIATVLAVIALGILTYTSITQSRLATQRAEEANLKSIEANLQKSLAEASERQARQSEREARQAQQEADAARIQAVTAKNNAAAQRSIARAQIYQVQPGELYTSTLLAINAWQVNQSNDAQEILRQNISLLPVPVRRMTHTGRINTIDFNDQGDMFVTAGGDGTTCAWQITTGEEVFCVDSAGAVNDAAFIPRQNVIVTGDEAGAVQFINLDNKAIEFSIPIGSPIEDVAMRKDGKFAAVTDDKGKIDIIDLTSHKKVGNELDGVNTKLSLFSPREFKLATGSNDGVVSIWSLTANTPPLTARKHKGEILALAFSPDGSILVSGGADGAAVVIETKTGKELFRCLNSAQVNDLAFAPNGSWFVTVSNDRSVRVWDAFSGAELLSMAQSNIVRSVKVSADGKWIATTGDDRTVRVWSAVTGTETYEIPLRGRGWSLGFSRDGKYLISGDQNGYVNIWDISAIFAPTNSIPFKGNTTSALYSPSGTWAAVAEDKRVWLWNSNAISKITRLGDQAYGDLLSNSLKAVFSAGDTRLGVLTAGNQAVIYNVKSNNPKTILPKRQAAAMVFSPDERLLVLGDAAGDLEVWNAVTGQFQSSIPVSKRILGMAATPKFLIVASQDELQILDVETFQQIDSLNPQGETDLLAVSADGSYLAAFNSNGQILIWKQVNDKFASPQIINRAGVSSLAFSPANNLLAAGATDHIFLFELSSLEEVVRIPVTGTVNSLAFSPDSSTLMSAALKFVQFWDVTRLLDARVTRATILDEACKHLPENLSEDQWNQLFENEKFKALCPNLPTP